MQVQELKKKKRKKYISKKLLPDIIMSRIKKSGMSILIQLHQSDYRSLVIAEIYWEVVILIAILVCSTNLKHFSLRRWTKLYLKVTLY